MNEKEIREHSEELGDIANEHAKRVEYYIKKAEFHLHQIKRIKNQISQLGDEQK